jgi:hypothetical protein
MLVLMRNDLDVYKVITLIFILCVWMLHWLISKRTKGLIGEENRAIFTHVRLLVLFILLILFDLAVVTIFVLKFKRQSSKMNDIYVISGFEVLNPLANLFSFLAYC